LTVSTNEVARYVNQYVDYSVGERKKAASLAKNCLSVYPAQTIDLKVITDKINGTSASRYVKEDAAKLVATLYNKLNLSQSRKETMRKRRKTVEERCQNLPPIQQVEILQMK